MKAATLLILVFSHAGHWLSGTHPTVQVSWAAQAPVAAAVVQWELRFDGAVVSSGRAPLADAKQPIEIAVNVPVVRVRTTFQWKYRLTPAAGGADIEADTIPIRVYPTDLIGDYVRAYAGKTMVLVDKGAALGQILTQAKVPFTQIDNVAGLATLKPNVVVVAEDMVGEGPFAQSPLYALARSGSQVMILRQTLPRALFGYALTERNIDKGFVWEVDHPLLAGFSAEDAASWLDGMPRAIALRLPADEPALELARWAPEAPEGVAQVPGPIDALLVTRRLVPARGVVSASAGRRE